ncbi:MAG: hypothetical protein J6R92_01385 [Akkermansia sp.]|nr:hypothetical protein [Akkermansia sp.]
MMKLGDLPVHVRQEVENALLPGEEVRYVTRPKTSFVEVLLRGGLGAICLQPVLESFCSA